MLPNEIGDDLCGTPLKGRYGRIILPRVVKPIERYKYSQGHPAFNRLGRSTVLCTLARAHIVEVCKLTKI